MRKLVTFAGCAAVALVAAGSWLLLPPSLSDSAAGLSDAGAHYRLADSSLPQIQAPDERSALFALGYLHATERLWQMDFNRRVAQGRLAEVLGPKAIEVDKLTRTLGVRQRAETIVAALDPELKALLDAYADGVNRALSTRKAPLPPEYLLTRAPAPEPWQPADSVAWTLLMAWDLSSAGFRNELTRLRLALALPKEAIEEFRPIDPRTASADYVELYRLLGLQAAPHGKADRKRASVTDPSTAPLPLGTTLALGDAPGLGSNNWVVAGPRSASGKPLLANDPHLGMYAPSLWYMVDIRAPGLNAFGATMPGVPYVILGRNDHVAWGFTNTGTDVQDLYLERLTPADPTRYATPSGDAPFTVRTEQINVKGGASIRLDVRRTRHGPVLSGVSAAVDRAMADPRFVVSLRWAALEGEDTSLAALRAMNKAGDAAEFIEAARKWTVVQQNMVFADAAGRIGLIAPGRVPVRGRSNDLHGLVPAPGWDARFDWDGWLAAEQMPLTIDPPDGIIVTANNDITTGPNPPYLTAEWALPYRAQRIEAMLRATPQHTPESFRTIQNDLLSGAAVDLLNALRALAPTIQPGTGAGVLARDRLFRWNGAMTVDAPEPLIFHAWMRELGRRIFEDDLGPDAADQLDADLTAALLNVLTGRARSRDWCDDARSAARIESCAALAQEALDDAVTQLTAATGKDVLGLKWGDQHYVVLEHRPMSGVPWIQRWFGRQIPVGGDAHTVSVASPQRRGANPYASRHAASLRVIFDLSPQRNDRWIYPGGPSGHPLSPRYDVYLEAWRRGDLQSRPSAQTKHDPAPTRQ